MSANGNTYSASLLVSEDLTDVESTAERGIAGTGGAQRIGGGGVDSENVGE